MSETARRNYVRCVRFSRDSNLSVVMTHVASRAAGTTGMSRRSIPDLMFPTGELVMKFTRRDILEWDC